MSSIILDDYNLILKLKDALGLQDYSDQIIHYTTTATLKSILETNELWFGRLPQMNDTTECNHFLDGVLENIHRVLGGIDKQLIEKMRPAIREETFVSSWCEYFDTDPDGKLSMWRGYGDHGEGLGIVVDSSTFQPSRLTPKNYDFFINSTKIEYVDSCRIIEIANDYIDKIRGVDEIIPANNLKHTMAMMLIAKAPSVKHQGFREEEEIRFLHVRGLLEFLGRESFPGKIVQNKVNEKTLEYYALPMKNYPEYNFDLRLKTIIKKIVLGPKMAVEQEDVIRNLLNLYDLQKVPIIRCGIPYV